MRITARVLAAAVAAALTAVAAPGPAHADPAPLPAPTVVETVWARTDDGVRFDLSGALVVNVLASAAADIAGYEVQALDSGTGALAAAVVLPRTFNGYASTVVRGLAADSHVTVRARTVPTDPTARAASGWTSAAAAWVPAMLGPVSAAHVTWDPHGCAATLAWTPAAYHIDPPAEYGPDYAYLVDVSPPLPGSPGPVYADAAGVRLDGDYVPGATYTLTVTPRAMGQSGQQVQVALTVPADGCVQSAPPAAPVVGQLTATGVNTAEVTITAGPAGNGVGPTADLLVDIDDDDPFTAAVADGWRTAPVTLIGLRPGPVALTVTAVGPTGTRTVTRVVRTFTPPTVPGTGNPLDDILGPGGTDLPTGGGDEVVTGADGPLPTTSALPPRPVRAMSVRGKPGHRVLVKWRLPASSQLRPRSAIRIKVTGQKARTLRASATAVVLRLPARATRVTVAVTVLGPGGTTKVTRTLARR